MVCSVDLTTLDFSAQDHAYGSIFYLVAGTCSPSRWSASYRRRRRRGRGPRRVHAAALPAVTNATRYWIALCTMWVIGTATLYLVPRISDGR